jgi:exopolysaccharide biosynthesis polyprenyl glycosylphosphotransferase
MSIRRRYTQTQTSLLVLLLVSDALVSLIGLSLGYWVRFNTALRNYAVEAGSVTYASYAPLITLGMLFFVSTYAFFGVYDARLLLRPQRSLNKIYPGIALWFCVFLGVSLTLKFEPPISRLFVGLSCFATALLMTLWRVAFYHWLSRSSLRGDLAQRVLLVGWTQESVDLAEAIGTDANHPYTVIGWIETPRPVTSAALPAPSTLRSLGSLAQLEGVMADAQPDIVVVGDFDLSRDNLISTATLCERYYVRFMVVPSFFQIFFSNLRSDSIAGVPVLGIADLRLQRLLYRAIKRCVDITGALVGLLLSIPIFIWVAMNIRREDPGPIFFRQDRVGQNGRLFPMFKLRSMKLGAEKLDHLAQSTARQDSRLLKFGSFTRRWNLDETPQFWNVLIGDMSLVGPRPEREFHANRLAREIPNYNTRHVAKPGMSGWAQVNGHRGESDLVARVKYDLYYIENWSIWFDIQIMVLTFFRRKNAY